jgi:hypothetical protein
MPFFGINQSAPTRCDLYGQNIERGKDALEIFRMVKDIMLINFSGFTNFH